MRSDADSEFLVKNITARVVSSSSFSMSDVGLTSTRSLEERWWLVGKSHVGVSTTESSEKGEVFAEQGEVGLS